MNIVVCVKQVIDTNFPFALDTEALLPLAADTFYCVNPADKCAAEAAVCLREQTGAEVIYISIGPPRVETALRECLALGGTRAIRISDEQLDGNSQLKAYVLAMALVQFSPDVVLCGSRSADQGSGQIPAAMAEHLGFTQVTGVVDFKLAPDRQTAVVTRKLERGRREMLHCPLPAVLALEAGCRTPRYAALPRLLEAHRATVSVLNASNIGIDPAELNRLASLVTPLLRTIPRPRPKKTFVVESGLSAEQRMELMMSGGLKQNKSDLLEGEPGDLAMKLAGILASKLPKH